ncbi:MAG: PadR family transcriptional regulator [Gemmatimonadota bacterium]
MSASPGLDGPVGIPYHRSTLSVIDNNSKGEWLVLRDVYLGFIRIHLLYHAVEESIYGLGMIAELERHGYEISPGTLYPILHGLEEDGLLEREDRVVGGKVRKYYRATEAGGAALDDVKEKLRELLEEVLEGRGPSSLPEPSDLDG